MSDFCVLEHARSFGPQLELAVKAAIAAGQVIRDGAKQIVAVEQKGVGDLVSEVDRDADRVATKVIAAKSDLPILSEEINSEQHAADDMWIVDPLDASSAFLMQAGPQYPAVLVALREQADLSLGVVYFPLTDEWFYAARGRGAWRDGRRLICNPDSSLNTSWVELNQYGNAEYETPFFTEIRSRLRSADGARLVTTNVPHSGVAMRIATGASTLAAAIHDNDPTKVKQAAWDIAAPQIIMEEAGGVFLNPAGDRTNPFAAQPIIVAASAALAHEILGLVVPAQRS